MGTLETELKTATGERIPCEIRGKLFDERERSERKGTAGIIRDVTDHRAREQRLQHQNERLDEFARVVSHDLRNPLNVAEGRVELARDECDSEHLDAASNAIDRCITLIDDLLTVAREGSRVDDVDAVDLANSTRECWRNIETADATLVVESEQAIHADQRRLRQLLENLLRNAVEHGGTDVTVTVGDLSEGLYVADDGPGIPAEEREEVFETGYSTTDDGTGFGLHIVHEIADAHGWDISVTESEAGGTRFEFTGVTVHLLTARSATWTPWSTRTESFLPYSHAYRRGAAFVILPVVYHGERYTGESPRYRRRTDAQSSPNSVTMSL